MRLSGFWSVLFSSFLLLSLLAGCGGGSALGPANTIAIVPTPVSLNVGQVLQLSATVTDAAGHVVTTETITYTTSDPFTVGTAPGGLLCAGTWDAQYVVCKPGSVGTATITATASPSNLKATTTVYVHQKADSVVVGAVSSPPSCGVNPPPPASCVSMGATSPANQASYTAIACSNDPNVCAPAAAPCQLPQNTVGPYTFATSNSSVVSTAADTNNPNTVAVATAKGPGQAQITASLSGTTSLAATFLTCPPASLSIHVANGTATTVSVAKGSTATLSLDAVDTNGISMTGLPVTWNSSNPTAATVGSGLVSGIAPGTSNIVVACAPPACNAGTQQAIYSNVVQAAVTGTANSSTVYVTSSDSGTTTMVPISTSDFSVGTAINLPSGFPPPNSMLMSSSGGKILLGTDSGLEIFDIATSSFSVSQAAKGKVLAVAPDSNQVLVADTTNPNNVYLYLLSANSFTTLTIANATAGAFAPDSSRVFIGTSGGRVYEFASSVFVNDGASGGVTGLALLASGSFAFAADPNTDIYSPCTNVSPGSVGTGMTLIAPAALPVAAPNNTQLQMIGVAPPSAVQTDVATTTPTTPAASPCPAIGTTPVAHDFGQGAWDATKSQVIVSPDSMHAVVTTPDIAKFMEYVVNTSAAAGTTIVTSLGGAATGTYTGGITQDSTNAYVGVAGINEVQVFKLADGSLVKEISVGFSPKLVVVRPQ